MNNNGTDMFNMEEILKSFAPMADLQKKVKKQERVTQVLELTGGELRVLKNIVNDWEEGRSSKDILPEFLDMAMDDIMGIESKLLKI